MHYKIQITIMSRLWLVGFLWPGFLCLMGSSWSDQCDVYTKPKLIALLPVFKQLAGSSRAEFLNPNFFRLIRAVDDWIRSSNVSTVSWRPTYKSWMSGCLFLLWIVSLPYLLAHESNSAHRTNFPEHGVSITVSLVMFCAVPISSSRFAQLMNGNDWGYTIPRATRWYT